MFVRYPYNRSSLAALAVLASVALGTGLGVELLAQTHRVAKPQQVTRAIGVYEWTGDLNKPDAARFVPVSLFINGHLEDAGVYLARPVPFVLGTGDLYAVEKAGEPIGTLDLDKAGHVVADHVAGSPDPVSAWYGYGRFTPPVAAPKAPALHTTAHPATIVGSSDRSGGPHLTTRSDTATTPAGDASKPGSAETPGTKTSADIPVGSDDSDPDRPHMSRRTDVTDTTGTASTANASGGAGGTTDEDPERPTLRRRSGPEEKKKRGKESGSEVRPMGTSLNDDPDRPTLRHGGATELTGTPELQGLPAHMHQAVAVSDAGTTDAHAFDRSWESANERASTLVAMESLARPRIANYLTLNALHAGGSMPTEIAPASKTQTVASPPASSPKTNTAPTPDDMTAPGPRLQRGRPTTVTPPPPLPSPSAGSISVPASASTMPLKAVTTSANILAAKRAASVSAAKAKAAGPRGLVFAEERLDGFTLSYGGLPTFVYSVAVPTIEGAPVRLTMVAQKLPSGELQVALSSVTDEAHLNRTQQLRLVDVVDPNGSHRASFLFEMRGKGSRQFALYSLTGAQAEQSFATGLIE